MPARALLRGLAGHCPGLRESPGLLRYAGRAALRESASPLGAPLACGLRVLGCRPRLPARRFLPACVPPARFCLRAELPGLGDEGSPVSPGAGLRSGLRVVRALPSCAPPRPAPSFSPARIPPSQACLSVSVSFCLRARRPIGRSVAPPRRGTIAGACVGALPPRAPRLWRAVPGAVDAGRRTRVCNT